MSLLRGAYSLRVREFDNPTDAVAHTDILVDKPLPYVSWQRPRHAAPTRNESIVVKSSAISKRSYGVLPPIITNTAGYIVIRY